MRRCLNRFLSAFALATVAAVAGGQQLVSGCNAAPSCRANGFSALTGNAGGHVLILFGLAWDPEPSFGGRRERESTLPFARTVALAGADTRYAASGCARADAARSRFRIAQGQMTRTQGRSLGPPAGLVNGRQAWLAAATDFPGSRGMALIWPLRSRVASLASEGSAILP